MATIQQHLTLHRMRRRYNLGDYGFPAIHPTANDWANRVVTNGGAYPTASVNAVSAFCSSLDNYGLTTLMLAVNMFAPDNLIASITPLFKHAGNDPWTNHSFVAGDLSSAGLKGDGAAKYLDTGLKTGSWLTYFGTGAFTNSGITLYFTVSNSNSEYETGAGDNALQSLQGLANQSTSSQFDCPYGTSGAGRISASNAAWLGYLSGNRTSATAESLYKASSTVAHTSIASGTFNGSLTVPSTIIIPCFALNNAGSISFFSSKRLSFAAYHQGLTSTQSSNFYSAVQALRTAMGGGFV